MIPARSLAVVLIVILAGCGGAQSPEVSAALDAEPFDREASESLLSEGRQVALADPAAAAPLYRAAGLRWPDNLEAWERLADAERLRGNTAEAEAAEFMVERLRLYPSEELYVQRQVNAALKTYLEEQQALPVRNESTLTYGARLSQFYDALLAERPAYSSPEGIFNLAPHEIPTAIITGGAGYVYFSTLGGS